MFVYYLRSNYLADVDRPPADNPHPSHYGYDISVNGNRVAGPGHVDFDKNVILRYYRLGMDANSFLEEREIVSHKGLISSGYLEYKVVIRYFSEHALSNSF